MKIHSAISENRDNITAALKFPYSAKYSQCILEMFGVLDPCHPQGYDVSTEVLQEHVKQVRATLDPCIKILEMMHFAVIEIRKALIKRLERHKRQGKEYNFFAAGMLADNITSTRPGTQYEHIFKYKFKESHCEVHLHIDNSLNANINFMIRGTGIDKWFRRTYFQHYPDLFSGKNGWIKLFGINCFISDKSLQNHMNSLKGDERNKFREKQQVMRICETNFESSIERLISDLKTKKITPAAWDFGYFNLFCRVGVDTRRLTASGLLGLLKKNTGPAIPPSDKSYDKAVNASVVDLIDDFSTAHFNLNLLGKDNNAIFSCVYSLLPAFSTNNESDDEPQIPDHDHVFHINLHYALFLLDSCINCVDDSYVECQKRISKDVEEC